MIRPNTGGYADDDLPASGYKYVRRVKGHKWQARPWAAGGRVNLGLHPTPLAAWQAVTAWVAAGCPIDHRWRAGGRPGRRRGAAPGGRAWRKAEAALLAHPDRPDGRLAAEAGVDRHTVGQVRRALAAMRAKGLTLSIGMPIDRPGG